MTDKKTTELVVNFLYEVGTLRKTPRSHMQTLLTGDLSDNIASHSYRVCVIGYFLALAEKADANKVLAMCIFHDISEARSGDQNWVHKKYVKTYEDEITEAQLASIPFRKTVEPIIMEYKKRKSPEAIIAKDADLLDQQLLLREYEHQGNLEAHDWLKDKYHIKRMSTKTAKAWAVLIRKTTPSDWWSNLWTSDRR